MKLVILIATCNRNELLESLLVSLEKMTPCPGLGFDVCVGDNSCSGSASPVVDSYSLSSGYHLDYLHCPLPGIPQVRNKLMEFAVDSGYEFAAFVDDDEVVSSDWLKNISISLLKHDEVVHAVHGCVVPRFSTEVSSWLPLDLYSRDMGVPTGTLLSLAATNNVVILLDFVKKHNLKFDERMALSGGSDTEFFYRFSRLGGQIRWSSEAVVYEDVPSSRMTLGWLVRRYFRYGNSDAKFWRLNHSFLNTIFWIVKRAGWNFLKCLGGMLLVFRGRRWIVSCFVKLFRSFGLIYGLAGFSYNEYKERHSNDG